MSIKNSTLEVLIYDNMGNRIAPSKCYITEIDTNNIPSNDDCIDYFIVYEGNNFSFKFHWDIDSELHKFSKTEKVILKGIALNNMWFDDKSKVVNYSDLKQLLNQVSYPKSPNEKADNLLFKLYEKQTKEGETIKFNEKIFDEDYINSLYFLDTDECNFYMLSLEEMGLINCNKNYDGICVDYAFTFKGLGEIISKLESGKYSNNCFIAMSFGEEMNDTRNSIKEAVIEAGFVPILIDEIEFKSDKTINDAIITYIKKSRFCIADFTQQRDGVYFEAGYALGKGLKVIYTCSESDFNQSHFDVDRFPFIIYNSPDELKERLKYKIEASIT